MAKFKTSKEVAVVGGYLVNKADNSPLNHAAFVAAQKRAHLLVTLAANIKGKTFEATKVDNLNDIINDTIASIEGKETREFVKVPTATAGTLTAQLKDEALAFIEASEEASNAESLNSALQEFIVVDDFEKTGLFFTSGVVSLPAIYTMKQITKAAKAVYAVVDSI